MDWLHEDVLPQSHLVSLFAVAPSSELQSATKELWSTRLFDHFYFYQLTIHWLHIDKCGTWSSNQTWNKAFGLLTDDTRTMFSTCEAPSSSNKTKNNWDPDLYIAKERKNHIHKRLRNKVSSSSGHEEEIELEIPVCSPPWVLSDSLFLPLSFPK